MRYKRLTRDLAWIFGCVVAVVSFVIVIMASGGQARWPTTGDWASMTLSLIALATAARLAVWAVRNRATWLALDLIVVLGVCLLAYGASSEYADRDRQILTVGAGLVASGILAKRRL
jgi:cytochrome bd-type quinol oxidase subunit 2